jgi:hypothetical protein
MARAFSVRVNTTTRSVRLEEIPLRLELPEAAIERAPRARLPRRIRYSVRYGVQRGARPDVAALALPVERAEPRQHTPGAVREIAGRFPPGQRDRKVGGANGGGFGVFPGKIGPSGRIWAQKSRRAHFLTSFDYLGMFRAPELPELITPKGGRQDSGYGAAVYPKSAADLDSPCLVIMV